MRTPYVIAKCRYCKKAKRFTEPQNSELWDYRFAHAETCVKFQEAITTPLEKLGEEGFKRHRVNLIGQGFKVETVYHKQKPEAELTMCGPRCRQATGSDCDCRCAGANHGIAHHRATLVLAGAPPR